MRRKSFAFAVGNVAFAMLIAWLIPSMAQEKKAQEKKVEEKKSEKVEEKKAEEKKAEEKKVEEAKEEKKKAEKVSGDVGLLDTEKNYMILVTKEGKLITLDFDAKTKVTMLEEKDVKMGEVGLGSAAVVEYQTKDGDKKVVTKLEFRPAKGE